MTKTMLKIRMLGERITQDQWMLHCGAPGPQGEMAMTEFLSKFNAGELIALIAVGGGLLIPILCGVTAIITDHFYKIRLLSFKQELINRGMTTEEICAVVEAGKKRSRKERCQPQAGAAD